jgi:pilus assembly protein CpaF
MSGPRVRYDDAAARPPQFGTRSNPDTSPSGIDIAAIQARIPMAPPAAGEPPPGMGPPATKQAPSDGARPAAAPAPAAPTDGAREAFAAGLTALMDRVIKAINVEPFTKATKPTPEQIKTLDEVLAAQMKALPDLREPLAGKVLAAARREFTDTGPIGPWLDDTSITQIQCLRYNQVELTKGGKIVPSDVVFSSGAALHRAMTRLAKASGREWAKGELIVERRLANGSRMIALVPPMAASLSLTIRKREPVMKTMGDLTKGNQLSERMATFLSRCVKSRICIMVTGNSERAALDVMAALAASAPLSHRLGVFLSGGEPRVDKRHTHVFGLPVGAAQEEPPLRMAPFLGFEQLLVYSPKASVAACSIMSIVGGASGIVIGLRSRTLQKGIALTIAELMLAKPGLSFASASLLVAHAVEVCVEVTSLPDGRACVTRIAELDPGGPGQPPALRELFLRTTSGDKAVFAETSNRSRIFPD